MDLNRSQGSAYRFGAFEVDLRARELRKHGRKIRIQDQPLRILTLLLEDAGNIVSREQMQATLWPDGTVVEFDNGLNAAMGKLRQALRDSAERPRYIETVPRQGYRFIGVLESRAEPAAPVDQAPPMASPARPALPRWAVAAGICLALALGYLGTAAIRAWRAAPPPRRTLVVLPFQDLDGAADQQYIANGITEELTTLLSLLDPQRLGVVARTSALLYPAGSKTAQTIARELHADYLLEGSVRRSGERVRVTVQLIRASDQTHLWAANYDRHLGDVLALEAEISGLIGQRISITLAPEAKARMGNLKSPNPVAYEAYLKGRYFLWSHDLTEESFDRAAGFFREALAADSEYAPAYAGLAEYFATRAQLTLTTLEPDAVAARRNSARALALDGQLAEAHLAAAWVGMVFDRNWQAAQREFSRTLELDPSLVRARALYAAYLLAVGRSEDAVTQIRRGLEMDPTSLFLRTHAGRTLYLARHYAEAGEECRKKLEVDPAAGSSLSRLVNVSIEMGNYEEAGRVLRRFEEISKDSTDLAETRAYYYARTGRRREARALLETMQAAFQPGSLSSYPIAILHAALGNRREALAWLEKAYHSRNPYVTLRLRCDPRLDVLRNEPEFQDLVRRMAYP